MFCIFFNSSPGIPIYDAAASIYPACSMSSIIDCVVECQVVSADSVILHRLYAFTPPSNSNLRKNEEFNQCQRCKVTNTNIVGGVGKRYTARSTRTDSTHQGSAPRNVQIEEACSVASRQADSNTGINCIHWWRWFIVALAQLCVQ
jgi:hypothetical protein